MTQPSPFKWFKTSPEIIRLAVMLYVRFPLSLRNVEDLLHERGVEISHETVRFWWHRFGPLFASEIRKRRIEGMKSSHWRWHLDEMFVKINGERHYLWRAVDHEGEVLESFVTKTRDKKAALKFLRKAMKKHGRCDQFPLSLRNVEDLLHERGIDISHETVRFWWNRFGPVFAAEIRKRRIEGMKSSRWRWHLDEMFVKINGVKHYLWRAVDHEDEVLESFVT
jgi:putative transposase